jgi:cytochrome c oxidase subunit III
VQSLWVTFALGAVFMFIKLVFEYPAKMHHGLMLGKFFAPAADIAALPSEFMFFSFYFMMTGLHGFHVVIGMLLIAWLAIRAQRGEFGKGYYTPVDLIGLYWHLVDLIWIYLFPLMYLVS